MVYYHESEMVVLGPNGCERITMKEGFRQGDPVSSLFYCMGLDHIIREIVKEANKEDIPIRISDILAFMDDTNYVLDSAEDAIRLAEIASRVFMKYGIEINMQSEKSSILAPRNDPIWTTEAIQQRSLTLGLSFGYGQVPFPVLGADISDVPENYLKKYKQKTEIFFNILRDVDVHPSILFTIVRICGNPRLSYLCSVMPDSHELRDICTLFDNRCFEFLNSPALLNGALRQEDPMIYDSSGAGFVSYVAKRAELYEHSRMRIHQSSNTVRKPAVALVSNHQKSVTTSASARSDWLFFKGADEEMSPGEYVTSLAIRLQVLPEKLELPRQCNCGYQMDVPAEVINHALLCSWATRFSFNARHECVTHHVMATAKSYGIDCTHEPTFYTYYGGEKKRPDVTFWIANPLAIDVTIVFPEMEANVRATKAAKEKIDKHADAVRQCGHRFSPFALEIFGTVNETCFDTIEVLSRELSPLHRRDFKSDMLHSISLGLAKARGNAVRSAIAILMSQNFLHHPRS
jgi:hypothetical protein